MGKVIGIDLGTTNSVAAVYESKNPVIILTQDGDRKLPSIVAFTQNHERLIGNAAKSRLITNPENTVYSVKRLMGKKFSEVEPYLHQFTYPIIAGDNDTLKIKINDDLFSPEEISAMILENLKEAAEHYLGSRIENAIITVPAYFNDSQRQATKDAGEIAGLNVIRIINEPTAASLSFSPDLKSKSKLLVYDFGGGTIDISILEIDKEIIKVIATGGNCNLGGNDFDLLLMNLLKKEFQNEFNIDLSQDKLAIQRILEASENAKKELSSLDACEINLPFMSDSEDGPIHLLRYLTRKELENLIEKKVDDTIGILKSILKKSKIEISEIEEILLVGGSTRIPMVQKKVKDFFNKEPNKKINPDEIVAMGAAIQGAIAKGERKDMLLLDVIPISLGIKTFGGTFTRIIDANTTIPTNRSLVFSTVDDNQGEVEINVYQGEREIAEENKLLGKFSLKNIKPAPKGVPRIEVNFNININGILMVTAMDLSGKQKKEVVISQTGLLKKEELAKIREEAKRFKSADLERKELIMRKTTILNLIYAINQFLNNPDSDPDIQQECKRSINLANQAIEKEDIEQMENIEKDLEKISLKLNSLFNAVVPTVETKTSETEKATISKELREKVDTRPLEYKKEEQKKITSMPPDINLSKDKKLR